MTKRKQMEELSANYARYQTAAPIADAVLARQIPDPTAGATHFLNPIVVRQRRDGSLPSWANGEGVLIGHHAFYAPAEAGGAKSFANALVAIAGGFSCGAHKPAEAPSPTPKAHWFAKPQAAPSGRSAGASIKLESSLQV